MDLLPGAHWYPAHRADARARALYLRHYSAFKRKLGSTSPQFVSPGQCMVLLTPAADALFVWHYAKPEMRLDKVDGPMCSVFRNEGPVLSSTLILEAEQLGVGPLAGRHPVDLRRPPLRGQSGARVDVHSCPVEARRGEPEGAPAVLQAAPAGRGHPGGAAVMDAATLAQHLTRVQQHLRYEVAQTRGLRVRVAALEAQNERFRECLEGMAWQFGHVFEQDGERWLGTMGLSNLEDAFEVLGWDDPHPFPADAG